MTRNLFPGIYVFLVSFHLVAQQAPIPSAAAGPEAKTAQSEPAVSAISDYVLQDGTPVKLQLIRALSSADARAGQEISFEVVDDIDVGGVTVLRRGTLATGVIMEAEKRKRMGRAGKLSFTVNSVPLADDEKAALRAVNDAKGDSHAKGMTALMVSVVPMAAAPFLLLMKGGDSTVPKGTQITAFIDGDMHLDIARFGAAPITAARTPAPASVAPSRQ